MYKKSLKLSLFLLLLVAGKANAQNVAINADGTNADASAMLDVKSTKGGVLIPRMTKAQRDAISNPAVGLMIFQTDNDNGFYYYQGNGGWVRLSTANGGANGVTGGWALNGNGNAGSNAFIGTTDYQDLVFKVNSAVVGRLSTSGSGAVAFGANTSAGQNGLALGTGAKSTANAAVAVGMNANASGQNAMVLGVGATGSTNDAIAIGSSAASSGYQGIAIGFNSEAAINNDVIALGNSTKAMGYQSTALGFKAQTESGTDGSVAIGRQAVVKQGVQNAVALGNGAIANKNNAIILGDNSAQVGIGTSSPANNAKLDVNGGFKLGAQGSIMKNVISGVDNSTWKTVPANGKLDFSITLTAPATSSRGAVAVSPAIDLPEGISIAWARMDGTNKVKVRFMNAKNTDISFGGELYITVTEF